MRIAMISYWACPLTRLGVFRGGGMSVYILQFANFLGMSGITVDIYTRSHHDHDEKVLETHKNVRVIHIPSQNKDTYRDTKEYAQKLRYFITSHNIHYDLLHAHYYYSGIVGLLLQKQLNIPLVQTFHTLGIMKQLYGGEIDRKRIETEKEIVQKVDGIIASTDLERDVLRQEYKGDKRKIFVVHPGVNHHIFRPYKKAFCRKKLGISQDKKIILFVGRIDPIKGIHLLIEAVASLSRAHPSFEKKFQVLLIGGDIRSSGFWRHPEVHKIKALIGKRQIDCCVKFMGSQPYDKLPFYYAASDIVVMPSVYESFGFVVLEALASGAAVLASKVGGLTYLIQDKINGRFFESNNKESLTHALWELLGDTKQRKKLSLGAFLSSQKYCWDKQAEELRKIYKKFL